MDNIGAGIAIGVAIGAGMGAAQRGKRMEADPTDTDEADSNPPN